MSDIKRLLAYVSPYWRRLALVLAVALLGTIVSLFLPYLSKYLVDTALLGRDARALTRIVGLFFGLAFVATQPRRQLSDAPPAPAPQPPEAAVAQ